MLRRLFALRETVGKRFVVAYCDTFIDIDLPRLLAFHVERRAAVTLVTAPIESPFGVVDGGSDGLVRSFVEKPVHDYFIGCFVMERYVLAGLPDALLDLPDGDGLVELFHGLISERRVAAYRHDGLNITFNTDSERIRAEQELDAFFTLREPARPAAKP